MLRDMRCLAWCFVLLVFFPLALTAQMFVYTNNDLKTANSISAFSVPSNGQLSEIAGSPFLTGGAGSGGGLYSANRIIVVGSFLYASNSAPEFNSSTGSYYNTVSAFTIDPNTGALKSVASPYPTQGFSTSSYPGVSLAATPTGNFLYAGTTDGNITIFSINSSTGALSSVGSAPAGGAMASMKVAPSGKYLAVALYPLNKVAMFTIQSGGGLAPVSGSPFAAKSGNGYITGIDIKCASTLLFAGRSGTDIDVFQIGSDGTLSELGNSPFSTGTVPSNQVVALSTDDSTLFSSNQGGNSVTAFAVGSDGSLTVPGTTVGAGSGALYPGGLAVSKEGSLNFLFAADVAVAGGFGGVSSFSLGSSSPLSFDFLTPTGQASGLRSIAAYPAKSCASSTSTTSLSISSLQITQGPPPGFDLEATLALDSSLVVDPLTQPVVIQVGSLTLNLPAGSFKTFQSGTNSSTYLFQGVINSTTLKVQITPLGQNQFQISVYDKQIDLTSLTNPITVTVGIGGNSATTSTTASFDAFTATPWHR